MTLWCILNNVSSSTAHLGPIGTPTRVSSRESIQPAERTSSVWRVPLFQDASRTNVVVSEAIYHPNTYNHSPGDPQHHAQQPLQGVFTLRVHSTRSWWTYILQTIVDWTAAEVPDMTPGSWRRASCPCDLQKGITSNPTVSDVQMKPTGEFCTHAMRDTALLLVETKCVGSCVGITRHF